VGYVSNHVQGLCRSERATNDIEEEVHHDQRRIGQ
jgi:hypothetical protein